MTTINITNSKRQSHNENRSFGGNFSWMHAFQKTGRTLTLNGNINISKNENNNTQQDSSIINKRDTLRNLINTLRKAYQIHTRVRSLIQNL